MSGFVRLSWEVLAVFLQVFAGSEMADASRERTGFSGFNDAVSLCSLFVRCVGA